MKLSREKQLLLEQRLKGVAQRQTGSRVIGRRPKPDSAPLSFAQRQMWVIDQITPGNPAYNLPVGFRILGPFGCNGSGKQPSMKSSGGTRP